MVDQNHKDRIRNELRQAGATRYALIRSEVKYLPQIIHEEEHIEAVVYGRVEGEFSLLVATDKRIIFMQRMALYTTTDEISYDTVRGVRSNDVGLFSSLILHTKINDYNIRYANTKCTHKFVKFIEQKSVEEKNKAPTTDVSSSDSPKFDDPLQMAGMSFIKSNDIGVLSTLNRTGIVSGSVVYYVVDGSDYVYILTRSESKKARGIMAHGQVALTIHEPGTLKVAEMQGVAEIEQDINKKTWVFDQIVKPRPFRGETHLPPVTKLESAGGYIIIRIAPTNIHFADYAKSK